MLVLENSQNLGKTNFACALKKFSNFKETRAVHLEGMCPNEQTIP